MQNRIQGERLDRPAGESARIALLHDERIRPEQLRQALAVHGCRIMDVFPNVTNEQLDVLRTASDLMIVPVDPERPETLERARRLAAVEGSTRVFAVTRPGDVSRCLDLLRDSGAEGLLATNATASHIEFRLNQVLALFPERRHCERVPVLLPVQITTPDGRSSREYAISLSIAGMGIASRRPVEPNTDLQIELVLSREGAALELAGRVIHCVEDRASIPPCRIGVFFRDPGVEARRSLEAVVTAGG